MAKTPVGLSESEVDAVLMKAAAQGDREALGGLFDRHSEGLHRLLTVLGVSPETSREILREVFSQAGSLKTNQAALGMPARVWLARLSWLVWNKTKNRPEAGDTKGTPALADDSQAFGLAKADPAVWSDRDAILQAIRDLSARQKWVFGLSELLRMDYASIGAVVEAPEAEVSRLKAGALLALHRRMAASVKAGATPSPEGATQDAVKAVPIFKADASTLSRIVGFSDGDMPEAHAREMERELDAEPEKAAAYDQILRARQAIRAIPAGHWAPGLFEDVDRTLHLNRHRKRLRRARIAILSVALILAIGFSVATNLLARPAFVERGRTWMFRKGYAETPPPAPARRPGDPAGWMYLARGRAMARDADGQNDWLLDRDTTLFTGETIFVEDAGRAYLILPDGSQIVAKGGARFRMNNSGAEGWEMELLAGSLWCSIFEQEKDFRILTSKGAIATIGADFGVLLEAAEDGKETAKKTAEPEGPVVLGRDGLAARGQSAGTGAAAGDGLAPDAGAEKQRPLAIAKASAPSAPENETVLRVVVDTGQVEVGDERAMMGERLTVQAQGHTEIHDAVNKDPVLTWSLEDRKSPIYASVEAFSFARRQALDAIKTNAAEPLIAALDETHLMKLLPDLTKEDVTTFWNAKDMRAEVADVSEVEIVSALEWKDKIVLRTETIRKPRAKGLLMLSKEKDAWQIEKMVGSKPKGAPRPAMHAKLVKE